MNERVVDSASDNDIQALRAEFKNLRTDFSKITELLKDTAINRGSEAADSLRATAERGWSEAKSTAQTVIEEMEERPLATVAGVFVAGVLFGLLLGGRR